MKNYTKEGQKLPLFGIGPILNYGVALMSLIAILLSGNVFESGIVDGAAAWIFRASGAVLIVSGFLLWYIGALKSGMEDHIENNRLKTDGIYARVRNPMYSGVWSFVTGITFMWHNAWHLLLIPIAWIIFTIVLKNTEEKWLLALYGEEYAKYKIRVNRLIPIKRIFKRSLKYSFILWLCRLVKLQRVMELPPEKAKKLFAKKYKGVVVPKLSDDEVDITTASCFGSTVVWYRHKERRNRVCMYLIGGGMLKYPSPGQVKEVLKLSKETDIDYVLPFYPLVHTGNTLTDVYEMVYELYKDLLRSYEADNIYFLGGSSGANLALGMISYINDRKEGLPMPGRVYAGSPGSLLISDEERRKADQLDKTDVIMSQKATLSVWEGMTGGKKVADYMESLQLGDYTGLKDVYLSFGADEVFTAAADTIRSRLEEYGVHVTMEIEEGLYHAYAPMPFVDDAMPGYERMKEYIRRS